MIIIDDNLRVVNSKEVRTKSWTGFLSPGILPETAFSCKYPTGIIVYLVDLPNRVHLVVLCHMNLCLMGSTPHIIETMFFLIIHYNLILLPKNTPDSCLWKEAILLVINDSGRIILV